MCWKYLSHAYFTVLVLRKYFQICKVHEPKLFWQQWLNLCAYISDWKFGFINRKKNISLKLLQSLMDRYRKFTDVIIEWYTMVDNSFFRNSALVTETEIRISLPTAMDVIDVSTPFVTLGGPNIFLLLWLMMSFTQQMHWRKELHDCSD